MKFVFSEKSRPFSHFCLSLLLLSLFVVEPLTGLAGAEDKPKPGLTNDQRIRQVLSRLTFGARPGDFERVKKIGVKAYIEEQINPETIDDAALDKQLAGLPTLMLATPTIAEQYNPPKPTPTPTPKPSPSPTTSPAPKASPSPSPSATPQANAAAINKETPKSDSAAASTPKPAVKASSTPAPKPTPTPKNPQMVVTELQRAKLLRAVYSERQLYETMVDFWENHFSIYSQKEADRLLLTGFDREAVRPFALGRFRDLLGATAQSPAMLYYLDNWQSTVVRKYPATKDKPARQTGGINENYARELMELHTLGVDGGYTQKDVQEVARCFTGWTIRKPNDEGVFVFNPQAHDNGEKVVLGRKIPAGGGIADAELVLDILAKHPSTAHFIATKLARRFLGDNPPAAVVNQAAQVFLKTDGSIRETLRSIVASPYFLTPAAYETKVKSPFEFAAAALRATNAETDANRPILDWITKMGQPVFGHLTPEGYPEQSGEWLSAGSLLIRFNFANALAANKIKGTSVDVAQLLNNVDLNNPAQVSSRLTQLMLQNEVSPRTKEELDKIAAAAAQKMNNAQTPVSFTGSQMPNAALAVSKLTGSPAKPANKMPDYIAELITLTLGAPEFQRK